MNGLQRYAKIIMGMMGLMLLFSMAGCGGGGGREPILGLPAANLVSLSVTPATQTIVSGTTQQYVAMANYSDGSAVDVSASSTWTSATPANATIVSTTGLATGIHAGSSVISAVYSGKTGTAALTVTAPTLVSIALAPVNPTVYAGSTTQLTTTATYSDNSTGNITNASSYVSASPATATVNANNGLVSAVAAGSSVVTVTYSGMTANTTVTVPASALVSLAVTPINPSIAVGGIQAFTATGTFADASTANITNSVIWSSGTPIVATILPSGVATGLTVGSTSITATSGALSNSTTLTVTAVVNPPVGNAILGSAANFGVLAGTSITNNSGGTTLVTGDVGSPSQTVDPVQAAGYSNYKSGAVLTNGLADLQVAITNANSRICDVTSAAGIDLGGLTFTPGVYCYAGSITLTGTFTMNGPGLYIFRTSSTIDTSANSIVALIGGATADNIYWVPVAPTTLGANSVFKGTLMAQSAAITMGDNASLQNGRVLSAAAITLKNNVITK